MRLDRDTKPPARRAVIPLMIESVDLDRLVTQVTCRITNVARLRQEGTISERNAEQQLRQAFEYRAELIRQIDSQNLVFDA